MQHLALNTCHEHAPGSRAIVHCLALSMCNAWPLPVAPVCAAPGTEHLQRVARRLLDHWESPLCFLTKSHLPERRDSTSSPKKKYVWKHQKFLKNNQLSFGIAQQLPRTRSSLRSELEPVLHPYFLHFPGSPCSEKISRWIRAACTGSFY